MVLENDDGVGLVYSDETRVLLPWNLVAVSVGLSQLDAALLTMIRRLTGRKP